MKTLADRQMSEYEEAKREFSAIMGRTSVPATDEQLAIVRRYVEAARQMHLRRQAEVTSA
jgi:hypothetical protein